MERLAQRQHVVDPERVREPEFRRAGVFRALFNHLRTLARRRRMFATSGSTCTRRTPAPPIYERLGMTRTHYEIFELDVRKDGERR